VRPVDGRVVGRFGTYDDPLLDVPMHRNGVELSAEPNDQVLALAPGEVVLVGALPGFERIVVIDHGGGYLSLTARLLTISVEQGQEIEAGTVLGRVGPKAVPDGLGTTVYVEIRHGQRPIDPRPYLRD
jgi:septal ring factor EnvC (AmiA/AmiB activator)